MATAKAPISAKDATLLPELEFVEVYDEPLHPTVFVNDYVRVLKVNCPRNQDTMFHRHSQDSFFLFFKTTRIRNEVVGKEPFEVELETGKFYWGDHLANPIIHKICVGERELDCMDVEFKADRPKPASCSPTLPNTSKRNLCFENHVMRAYRVHLAPGQAIDSVLATAEMIEGGNGAAERFAYLAVAMKSAKLSRGEVKAGDNWWCGGGSGDVSGGIDCAAWSNLGEEEAEVMILQPK